jgi:hypothetical protein
MSKRVDAERKMETPDFANGPVAGSRHKVQARMDAGVGHALPVETVLLLKVRIVARVDGIHDGLPAETKTSA